MKEFSTLRGAVVVLDKSVQDFSIDIHGLIATALLCVFHSLKLPDEGWPFFDRAEQSCLTKTMNINGTPELICQ